MFFVWEEIYAPPLTQHSYSLITAIAALLSEDWIVFCIGAIVPFFMLFY
jgi:hypothetical protein